jgi:peptide/nickel transport system substrate-binding protein
MDTETDGSLRIDQANEAAEKIWTAVHTLPLYQLPALVAVKSNLANYGSFGFGTPKWEDVGYVK